MTSITELLIIGVILGGLILIAQKLKSKISRKYTFTIIGTTVATQLAFFFAYGESELFTLKYLLISFIVAVSTLIIIKIADRVVK